MSALVTNPTPQLINPLFGNVCENAKVYIGKIGTDALDPDNRQDVYLVRLTQESTLEKVSLPQPLLTNSAGVICYEGLPVTAWVDSAYSITIVGYDGAIIYSAFYVDDPTYWLRIDLATEPKKTADGLHYDPEDIHGVNMVAGSAPILSPEFEGEPKADTPPAGDHSTRLATTEFVTSEINKIATAGVVGTFDWWLGASPPVNAVIADGSQLNKETYPELYAILGDQVAIANGMVPDSAAFYVPDVRSRYVRGTDNGASRSNYAQMLKYYDDRFKKHRHGTSYSLERVTLDGDEDAYFLRLDPDIPGGGGSAGEAPDDFTEEVGDSETMPMTVPMLPIIWVKRESTAVVEWWSTEAHQSARPTVHRVHPKTGEYLFSSPANPSPLEPGVWLTPANTTQDSPPPHQPGHVLVYRDKRWVHDAELFQQRINAEKEARQTRERINKKMADNAKRRSAINDWMQKNGAPFTLDDLE